MKCNDAPGETVTRCHERLSCSDRTRYQLDLATQCLEFDAQQYMVIDRYRRTSWYRCFLKFGLWDALGPSGRVRMEHLWSLHRGKWCCWPDTCLKIWYSGAFVVCHRWFVMWSWSLLSLSFEVGDACFAHSDAAQREEQKARTIRCQHFKYTKYI